MQPESDAVVPKKLSRERETGSRVLRHTQTRARKGEERERVIAVLIMKKSSGSSFQNLQGTNKLRLVKEWCRCCSSSKKRKHNCASPSEITFSPIGGSSFSSSPSSCARCFVPVFSRSYANGANDDDSPFCTSLSLLRYT